MSRDGWFEVEATVPRLELPVKPDRPQRTGRRRWPWVVGVMVAALIGLVVARAAGWIEPQVAQVAGVCVDTRTMVRQADSLCGPDASSRYALVFYTTGQQVPPVGGLASGGSLDAPPKEATIDLEFPVDGGLVGAVRP